MKSRDKFLDRAYKEKNDVYQRLGTLAVSVILILGFAFVCYTYHTQNTVTKQYLNEIALQSASRVHSKINNDLVRLSASAANMESVSGTSDKNLETILKSEHRMFSDGSVIRLSYINPDNTGIEISADGSIKKIALPPGATYIKEVLESGEKMTTVTKDSVSGTMAHIYALPISNGDEITAVHCGVFSLNKLDTAINANYFDNNGHSYVVKKDGSPVFINKTNERDAFFNAVSEAFAKRVNFARNDSIVIRYGRTNYWITYTPVNYEDWYLLLVVPNTSINSSSERVVIFSVIILLSTLITSVLFLRHMDYIQSESQDELYERACIDEVTGIFNKTGFAQYIDDVLHIRSLRFAVVYFDFDNFKAFNDLFGYAEGDRLLKHAADILADDIGKNETCGRFSGDNFYALFTFDSQSKLESRINKLMEKFSSFEFSQDTATAYDIICHCGIFLVNDLHRGRTVDFYVDRAKMALSSAEKNHTNGFIYYDDSMRKNLVFEAELENDLMRSLENNDFKVNVQPKYNVKTQKLAGGEALIRWQHPTKGFLTPNRFVDIFERNGQITEIDFYVLEQVCKMQREWMDLGLRPIVISVNQSRMHLYKHDYYDRLKAIIKKYKVEPKYIELEITETVAMSNTELLSQAVNNLHKMGFRVSIDDFGAGQSSLNVLKDIDVDVIKLDRGFFIELSTSPKGKEIITTVIGMASRLNIETVSEGIETQEQFNFIYQAGCNLVQGFLFGKPMPIDEFSELFKES